MASHIFGVHDTTARLWGAGDLGALFVGGAPKVVCPWPRASRTKGQAPLADQVVPALLDGPVWLDEIDPRWLYSSQPWVVLEHAAYYLTGRWERTGETSADGHEPSNQYPIIAVDHRGRDVILTGHHRSTAALIQARPLRCRRVPNEPDGAVALTPSLLVGEHSRLAHVPVTDVCSALDLIHAGHTVLCADPGVATAIHERVRAIAQRPRRAK
jgi:hypothetical protein